MKLRVKGIKKTFQNRIVLNNISYDFSNYGLYLITGRSGTGKTTLLNIIAGYEPKDEGVIEAEKISTISYMFQNFELINTLNIKENILLYPNLCNDEYDIEKYQRYIEYLGLNELLTQQPSELSQGQRQRVNIARALCVNSDIILCDEPTEALDEENASKVMELLLEIAKEKIIIMVTHDKNVLQLRDAIILMLKNGVLEEIQGKQKKESITEKSKEYQEISIKNHNLKKCINNILNKKSKTQFRFLIFCVILIYCFALAYSFIFVQNPIYNLINRNNVYVESNGLSVSMPETEVRKLTIFQNENLNGLNYEIHVYPYPDNAASIPSLSSEKPKDDGIILNQVAAELYMKKMQIKEQELIGSSIELKLKGIENRISFVVQGVANEQTEEAQLYYNLDNLKVRLEEMKLNDIKTGSVLYEFVSNERDRETVYQNLKKAKSNNVYNSEFSQLEKSKESAETYFPYFTVILCLAIIIQIVYVLNQTSQDWKYHRTSLMIILSVGASEGKLKQCYLEKKIKLVLIQVLFVSILVFITHIVLDSFPTFLFFVYLILLYGVFLTSTCYYGNKLNKSSLSYFLKEDKNNTFV